MRRPSSYLIESAWQGNFSCQAIYFCKSRRQTHPESSPPLSKPSKPASNAAADFHINRWRMSPRCPRPDQQDFLPGKEIFLEIIVLACEPLRNLLNVQFSGPVEQSVKSA